MRSRTQTSARAATLAAFLAAPDADTAVEHAISSWLCGGRSPGAAARTTKQQRGQTSLDFCHARWRKANVDADHRCENARHHGVVWSTDALPARGCAGVRCCDRKWQARRRRERRAGPCTQSMAAADRPRRCVSPANVSSRRAACCRHCGQELSVLILEVLVVAFADLVTAPASLLIRCVHAVLDDVPHTRLPGW